MSIQIYWHKKNFATQKAERFFKERRIAYQSFDLKRHKLGKMELEALMRPSGPRAVLDLLDTKVLSHPVAYTQDRAIIIDYVLMNPRFLVSPIVRSGSKVVIGFDEQQLMALTEGAS